MALISVIIPTFNRQNSVVEAIQSVLDQGDFDLEIIVVDDGSTDNTRDSVDQFADECLYIFRANGGPAAARNTGLKLAQGEIIAFLDSDDLWLPGKLKRDLELFEKFPAAQVLSGNAESYIEKKLKTVSVFGDREIEFPASGIRPFCWSLPIMQLGPSSIMSTLTLRKTALESLSDPVFDERLRFDEDWDLEFRLFSACQVLLYEQVVCRKRAFDDGTRGGYSISGKKKSVQEQKLIWKTQASILERYIGSNNWKSEIKANYIARRDELKDCLIRQADQFGV